MKGTQRHSRGQQDVSQRARNNFRISQVIFIMCNGLLERICIIPAACVNRYRRGNVDLIIDDIDRCGARGDLPPNSVKISAVLRARGRQRARVPLIDVFKSLS